MNEWRFRYIEDRLTKEVYDTEKAKSLKHLCDNLATENGKLRHNNTRMKLILHQIIADLEKSDTNVKYINWIKDNCNIELYSSDLDELTAINQERTNDLLNLEIIDAYIKGYKHEKSIAPDDEAFQEVIKCLKSLRKDIENPNDFIKLKQIMAGKQ